MISAFHIAILRTIWLRLEDLAHPWAITGSLGLALQQVDVAIHDIDLQTDRGGATSIQDRFADCVVRPVRFSEAPTIRSHFGELAIAGCKVEIMGDIEKRLPSGAWSTPPDLPRLIRLIDRGTFCVPVLDLNYERQAYADLGRQATVRQIEKALRQRHKPLSTLS